MTGISIGAVHTNAMTNFAAAHHQSTVRVAGDTRSNLASNQTTTTSSAPSTDARASVAIIGSPILPAIGAQPGNEFFQLFDLGAGQPMPFREIGEKWGDRSVEIALDESLDRILE